MWSLFSDSLLSAVSTDVPVDNDHCNNEDWSVSWSDNN